MKPLCVFVLALSLFGLSACVPAPQNSQVVQPKYLFDLGYGLQDRMIGLLEGNASEVELYMREGIFHILDPALKRITRTSSYGDMLSSLYDPEAAPAPSFDPAKYGENLEAEKDTAIVSGRYAVQTRFSHPSRIGVDSAQRIFIADRIENDEAIVFDPLTGSYSDWIVRRFGENGKELQYLGREGALGSAFPRILNIDCLGDDSVVVVSASASLYTVYRFSSDAKLLSSVRIDTDSLPIPLELVDSQDGSGSAEGIHADMENLLPMKTASGFSVILKLNYYRETTDSATLIDTGLENAGSWIFSMDGTTGLQNFGFQIEPSENSGQEWEILGVTNEHFLLSSRKKVLRNDTGEGIPARSEADDSRALRLVDSSGKVLSSCEIRVPDEEGLLRSLRVSSSGQLYGILLGRDEAKLLWWELPF